MINNVYYIELVLYISELTKQRCGAFNDFILQGKLQIICSESRCSKKTPRKV